MTEREDYLDRLRREQAERVMPLIGPLLDAWEQMPNDVRSHLDEGCPMLSHFIERIYCGMEADADGETGTGEEDAPR